jgi:hypothetical protein
MIFPIWMLKSVNGTFGMEYDQRVMSKFLLNKRDDAHNSANRLQAKFDEHAYQFRTIYVWITEARLGRQDLHDEICTRRSPLADLDAKILAI